MSYASLLKDTLTLWTGFVPDGFGGGSYTTLTTIKGRYQQEDQRYVDDVGVEFRSRAVIYTLTELNINDWIYNGTSIKTDPQDEDEAHKIRMKYITHNPNKSVIVYKYILGAY